MGASEYAFLLKFAEVAPVVGVMAVVIVFLWRDNRSLVKYIREMDHANLETLNDLSAVLKNLVVDTDKNTSHLDSKIKDEAEKTRNHVDNRVDLLEIKIAKSEKKG